MFSPIACLQFSERNSRIHGKYPIQAGFSQISVIPKIISTLTSCPSGSWWRHYRKVYHPDWGGGLSQWHIVMSVLKLRCSCAKNDFECSLRFAENSDSSFLNNERIWRWPQLSCSMFHPRFIGFLPHKFHVKSMTIVISTQNCAKRR